MVALKQSQRAFIAANVHFRTSLIPQVAAIISLLLGTTVVAADAPRWMVIGTSDFLDAAKPLIEHRRAEGYRVVTHPGPIEHALADSPWPDFVLLLGDDDVEQETALWSLPARRVPLYRWRAAQQPQFASDAAWGDRDGKGMPDIAIGRIPARTREQVSIVVRKILAYEVPAKPESLRLIVWTGAAGYGAIDRMAGMLLRNIERMHAPVWLEPWIICASAGDALCGWPPDQPRLFSEQLQHGGLLAILMGHANPSSFHSMDHNGESIEYSADDARAMLTAGSPSGPLVFFSCHSGDFTSKDPCMAEEFLFMPAGPVASIAATTESHPLTNYLSSVALLEAMKGKEKHLGLVWRTVIRETRTMRDPLMESVLRDAEGSLEDPINVTRLRHDQALMYVILGDPATLLPLPDRLDARVMSSQGAWHWSAEKPAAADHLEVSFRLRAAADQPNASSVGQDEANRALAAANGAFAFQRVQVLRAEEPWEGTITHEGTLRLIATAPGILFTAGLELTKASDSTTPPSSKPASQP